MSNSTFGKTWIGRIIFSKEPGAIMARRLLPPLVALPFFVGWLRVAGERMGIFSSATGVIIAAFVYISCFAGLIWLTARSINRLDRRLAENRLHENETLRQSEGRVRQKLLSILSPEGDIGNLELGDIIDIAGIQTLMDNFNELARIPMAIIDLKGKVLVGTGWQEICTGFHRVHPETCRNCIESDTELSKEISAGEFKLYKCKNHLWDMATPIIVGGEKMGNLFMGQFFFEEDVIDYELFRLQAGQFGFNEREYLAALDKVPRISRRNIDRGKAFFIKLAEMLSQESFSNIKLARSLAERKETEEALQRMVKRFEILTDTAGELLGTREPQEIIESLCHRVMEHLGCNVFFNYLVDKDAGKLHLNAFEGIPEREAERIEWLDYGIAVCGCAARDGCRIVAEHIPTTPDPCTDLVKSYGVKAYACHPLQTEGGTTIGTLSFGTRDRETFSNDDLSLMKAVADQVATAMTRKLMEEEREALLNENRRRKDFLNAVIENTPYQFSVTLGQDHRYAIVNKTLRGVMTFAGLSAEAVGRTVAEVWAGDPGLGPLIGCLDQAFSTGKIVRCIDECRPFTGPGKNTEGYFTTLHVPFRNDHGEVYGVLTITIETTEQVLARKKVEESESRFRRLIEQTPIPLCYVNNDGALVYFNERFGKTFGYSHAAIPTLADLWRLACPDEQYREWVIESWNTSLVKTRNEGTDIQPIEYRVTCKNRDVRSIEISGIIIEDNVLATFFDITERKKRERELRKFNRILKALSKSSQAMMRAKSESEYLHDVCRIVVEDCGHTMVWIGFAENDNAKTVCPTTSAGFDDGYLDTLNISWADTERGRGPTGTAIRTGKPIMCRNMLTDPDFLPWRAQAVKRGYASSIALPLISGVEAFGAITIYSRDPDPFTDDEVRLLADLANDLAYGILTIRSTTARTRAEEALNRTAEELSRSNKDLEIFAYAASHDLQEPLRAVAGFMGILEKQYKHKLDKEAGEYIAYAVEGAERMQRLIHDLLLYSRVGTRAGMQKPSSMQEAFDAALCNLRLSIEESNAVVTSEPLPVITADMVQMTQVFQNLIGNAVKFRGERRPEIAVSARSENGRWIFSVSDNGIGIEAQYFDRIFLIFQRLHSREQYGGTGIGLAVVKKIIERHAGTIWVDSIFGMGSTFYFSIPD